MLPTSFPDNLSHHPDSSLLVLADRVSLYDVTGIRQKVRDVINVTPLAVRRPRDFIASDYDAIHRPRDQYLAEVSGRQGAHCDPE